jgi:signal transduction histidine kinase
MNKNKTFIKVAFICSTFFLIVMSFITYLRIENLIGASKQLNHTSQVELALNNIFSNLKDVESGQRGYLLTNDSVFLDHYKRAEDNLTLYFRELDSLANSFPLHRKNIKILRFLVYKRMEQIKSTMEDAGVFPKYSIELLEGKTAMNDVRNQIDKMKYEEDRLLKENKHELNEETLLTPLFAISLMFVSILILVVAYYRLIRELKISIALESDLAEKNIALKTHVAMLTTMNKELELFTYISSHDLQEPLRKIQTFIKFMIEKEDHNLSQDGKFYLQRIYIAANRVRDLIEDLLKYSLLKKTDKKLEKIDINLILKEIINDYKEIIEEKMATIEVNCPCEIMAIRFQIHQLMDNLISNSLKYSKSNIPSKILIDCKILPGQKLNNKNLFPGINYCHISVTDNGIGFDSQYKDRIFEVFQRLHSYDEYEGSGMGLAICKRIVENHGGTITATGIVNQGARFDIYIPVG